MFKLLHHQQDVYPNIWAGCLDGLLRYTQALERSQVTNCPGHEVMQAPFSANTSVVAMHHAEHLAQVSQTMPTCRHSALFMAAASLDHPGFVRQPPAWQHP